MSKFVLIDGHAILHRAYHSMPANFTSPDGIPTNAIYGFMNMLLAVLDSQKPDFLAVAFDLPQPTFRMQQYTQYQAKRPEMQGNLAEQIPVLNELLKTLKIAHFEKAGFEADDVIGTLAIRAVGKWEVGSEKLDTEAENEKKSKNQKISPQDPASHFSRHTSDDVEVVIVTGDRDMLQLVNERVKVCVPVKGLSETKIYNEKLIDDEFGVRPDQWVDVKALKGDASDNYPGVRGIGPKTAQDLIAKYGTLEKLYKNLGKLEPKVAKKLAEGAEDAGMAKKLARIVTDVPVHLDLEKASVAKIDWESGAKFMRSKLGFKSIPEKIEKKYKKLNEPRQLGLI